MPTEQCLGGGSRLRVYREPIVGWYCRCALLAEGLPRIETEIVNVGIEADGAWDARVFKLLDYVRVWALIVFAGPEGLAPERDARMAWDDCASISLLGHVAPDGQC